MADIFKPIGPSKDEKENSAVKSKLVWFVLLAVAGAAVVASGAYLLRALLFIG